MLVSDLRDINWNYDEDQKSDLILGTCSAYFSLIIGKRKSNRLRVIYNEWGLFGRLIVILQTDMDWSSEDKQKRIQESDHSGVISLPMGILYIFAMTILIAGFILGGISGLFTYLALGMLSSVITFNKLVLNNGKSSNTYFPFNDKVEWQKYQQQLASFDIPEYANELHGITYKECFKEKFLQDLGLILLVILAGVLWPIALSFSIKVFRSKPKDENRPTSTLSQP